MSPEQQEEARQRMAALTTPPGQAIGIETAHEWAMRAPTDPWAIKQWLSEAPPVEVHRTAPPPATLLSATAASDDGEVERLRSRIEVLEREAIIARSPKGRRQRKSGRTYLTADGGPSLD